MTEPVAPVQLTIPARLVREGDVFELHRRTRTCVGYPGSGIYETVVIPLEGGGVAQVDRDRMITVTRIPRKVKACYIDID
ncbi:hypothetical protein [Streptomyces sp. NPDC006638]|uniref:hypothetical protein n=1 Tax=Streptomyces sp. NPDC006638 TaxID=3157183 RepID=UPI0033BB94F5